MARHGRELESRIAAQAAEIKGLREALEEIKDKFIYYGESIANYMAMVARKALAKKEWK